jgi:hypothetical protein
VCPVKTLYQAVAITALILVRPITATVEDKSAERWVSLCRPVVEAPLDRNGDVVTPDTFSAGRCFGAFESLQVLSALQIGGKPALGICPPTKTTMTQWVAVFVEYTKRHPERYQEPFARVALDALAESFPCRGK